jgi:NADPH-dependent glutamate synthase beta subunit-like oxidoreductase
MGAQVKVAYRRSREEIPAIQEEIEEAIEEGIQIVFLTSPVRILMKNKKVVGVECVRNQLTGPGEDGRAIPVPIQGSNYVFEVDTLLTAVGESPDLSIFSLGVQSKGDRLQTGEKVLEKIFVGGDLLQQPRTVIHAIQSGKEGAMRIDQYLRNGRKFEGTPWTTITAYQKGELETHGLPVKFEELNMSYFDHEDRLTQGKLRPETRNENFKEINLSISEGSAIQEAKRCFQCGICTTCKNCYIFCPDFTVSIGEKVTIDYDYCKGCCICVEECPSGVMMAEVKF